MKFAGPSMGGALGSGFMQGMESSRQRAEAEELARDTSAMATYSKLVQSGEWEPVGKEGSKDGGVLRVGNVGMLKKVPRRKGLGLKEANILSQMKSRQAGTELAREKFEYGKTKPKKMITVENPQTGERKLIELDGLVPPGFFKIGTVNAPIMAAQDRRTQSGRELSVARTELSTANRAVEDTRDNASAMAPEAEKGNPTAIEYVDKYKEALEAQKKAQNKVDSLLAEGKGGVKSKRKLPFDTVGGPSKELPMEVPKEFLDAAEEHWLRNTYSQAAVDEYMNNYDKYQEYIKSGTISKKEILSGIERLLELSGGGARKFPMPSRDR